MNSSVKVDSNLIPADQPTIEQIICRNRASHEPRHFDAISAALEASWGLVEGEAELFEDSSWTRAIRSLCDVIDVDCRAEAGVAHGKRLDPGPRGLIVQPLSQSNG